VVGNQPGVYYMPAGTTPQMMHYPPPMQQQQAPPHMPHMSMPPNGYAPASHEQMTQHNSMYGGYYAPPAAPEHSGFPPTKASELPHSPSPPNASAVSPTPVSSDVTPERHNATVAT